MFLLACHKMLGQKVCAIFLNMELLRKIGLPKMDSYFLSKTVGLYNVHVQCIACVYDSPSCKKASLPVLLQLLLVSNFLIG